MVIGFTRMSENESLASPVAESMAALVAWLACDLEASLSRLSTQLDVGAWPDARSELAAVRRMVTDLVELQCGLGSAPAAEVFDLAYADRVLDETAH